MKKTISILLITVLVFPLVACKNTANIEEVPSDTERVVQITLAASNEVATEELPPKAPEVEYLEEQYRFSTIAVDGRLNVDVNAQVRYPASLKMPIARVSAVGFTQEQASAYFKYFFAGEQPILVENYGAAKVTKQSLRDLIALYEQQIEDGTILLQSQLTEDEAREEIKQIEAQIPDAPDTVPPDVISDGTMVPGVWMNNDDPEQLLQLNIETENKYMDIYTPVNADEHAEGHLFFSRRDKDNYYNAARTPLAPNTSIEGMRMNWDDAIALCNAFLAIGGVNDMTVGEVFQLDSNGTCAYFFTFVRKVAGVPLAVNYEGTTYKGAKTPWSYETLNIIIDDDGICDVGWGAPVKTTEIVNAAADVISFAQAKEIFETMVVQTYEPKTKRYDGLERNISLTVDEILLSILRIRDVSTNERVGLYVPAWVFYGTTATDNYPNHNWNPQIVFAINAIDGSVINMEQGY